MIFLTLASFSEAIAETRVARFGRKRFKDSEGLLSRGIAGMSLVSNALFVELYFPVSHAHILCSLQNRLG